MQIQIKASPSEISPRTFTLNTFADLDITTKDWEMMSEEDKALEVQKFLDNQPEQPYWSLDTYEEK